MKLPPVLARLRNIPIRWLASLLIALVRILPEQQAYALGAGFGSLVYAIQPNWRRNARRNLELFYMHQPEWARPSPEEFSAVAQASARHLGWEVVEFIRIGQLDRDQALAMVVASEGEEHVHAALEKGKGVIIVGMHYGNWELTGGYISSRLVTLHAVGKAQRDDFFTRFAFEWRAKLGIENIFAGKHATSAILRALKANEALGLVSDQNGGKEGLFAPFCGIPASCAPGAATLAVRTGAPLVAVHTVRLAPGRHRWVGTPIDMTGLPPTTDAAVVEVQTRINVCIERIVAGDPAQWLLGHKRWRTRPAGEPRLYR